MSFFKNLFKRNHTKNPDKFVPIVAQINSLEEEIKALSNEELKEETNRFKASIKKELEDGKDIDNILQSILPRAFACVREASRRTLGQRHFDVQLIGGMVLNSRAIAEMRTGEGKTLVATLPVYLNALVGKGVHVVTVNDYLSRRDAVWMGQIYNALGLSVGVLNHESSFLYDPNQKDTNISKENSDSLDQKRDETGSFKVVHEFLRSCARKDAYEADITYGTNSEFGFDYLRDNLEYSPNSIRQREPFFAVVDEIDSILIDEARTPLIISAPVRDAESIYKRFADLVRNFKEDEDYTVDLKKHAIVLTDSGMNKAEKELGVDNIYTEKGIKYVHHLETAVRAKALFHINKEYVVKDNEIIIVDEFTGRLQPGRRWSEGLHQAVEAKEGVKIQQESRTYASITYQNFFRMYPKLAGMTGTASTSAEEFYKVYALDVYSVPTNVPAQRQDKNDLIFRTEIGKYKAIARKVKELNAKGQPVLIGTVTIEKNELLSKFLKAEGVNHTILNAKPEYAEREGEIVAQAGKLGAVTIATNMAGRGVDIKLGGNPNTPELYSKVKDVGGLYVLGTERHEARRIDNQLRGRSGRQGDPGETQFFVSLEDNLMKVFASDTLKSMMGRLGMPEDEPIQHSIISRALETAQEKIEGINFDARKHVLEFDDVINQQRSNIYRKRRKVLLGSVQDVEDIYFELIGNSESQSHTTPDMPIDKSIEAQTDKDAKSTEISKSLETKYAEFGRDNFLNALRIVILQVIDMYWVEHLEVMDYARSSVNLRAYGQRDPLVEYKKEGLRLFKEMQSAMIDQLERIVPNIVPTINGNEIKDSESNQNLKEVRESANAITADSHSPTSKSGEVGRNDLCPCGSGKKYKKCHGA